MVLCGEPTRAHETIPAPLAITTPHVRGGAGVLEGRLTTPHSPCTRGSTQTVLPSPPSTPFSALCTRRVVAVVVGSGGGDVVGVVIVAGAVVVVVPVGMNTERGEGCIKGCGIVRWGGVAVHPPGCTSDLSAEDTQGGRPVESRKIPILAMPKDGSTCAKSPSARQ